MFSSLKTWINLPVSIKMCTGRTGTGAKIYASTVDTLCYAEGKVLNVINSMGKEVVSMKQLYFNGDIEIGLLDTIIFEGKEASITSVATFYRNGVADIKVVYL